MVTTAARSGLWVVVAFVCTEACGRAPAAPLGPTANRFGVPNSVRYELIDVGALGLPVTVVINNSRQVAFATASGPDAYDAFLWHRGRSTNLGGLGGAATHVVALNSTGQVAGWSTTASGDAHAFLWEPGGMRDLGTLGGPTSHATALNDRGQVAGYSTTADGSTHAFLWHGGRMTDLGTLPGGTSSRAAALNLRGQVAGSSTVSTGQGNRTRAVLWDRGRTVDLGALTSEDATGIPGVEMTMAVDLNDWGVVVGRGVVPPFQPFSTAWRGFEWRDGNLRELGLVDDARVSTAVRINNRGHVAGMNFGFELNDPPIGVVWERGVVRRIGSLDTTAANATFQNTWVYDMNQQGWIVGRSRAAGRQGLYAYIWEDGAMQELPGFGGQTVALSINEWGDVAGWGFTPAPDVAAHVMVWQRNGGAFLSSAPPGATD